jgi:hypothetical protein
LPSSSTSKHVCQCVGELRASPTQCMVFVQCLLCSCCGGGFHADEGGIARGPMWSPLVGVRCRQCRQVRVVGVRVMYGCGEFAISRNSAFPEWSIPFEGSLAGLMSEGLRHDRRAFFGGPHKGDRRASLWQGCLPELHSLKGRPPHWACLSKCVCCRSAPQAPRMDPCQHTYVALVSSVCDPFSQRGLRQCIPNSPR